MQRKCNPTDTTERDNVKAYLDSPILHRARDNRRTRPCTRGIKVLRYYTITLHPFRVRVEIEWRELHFL